MAAKSFYSILSTDSSLPEILSDCQQAFNCRSLPSKGQNYSTGATYFIKGNDRPRCNLEVLAKQVFDFHTKGMDFNPSTSGAEWWTQVIDSRDDIGFHWDRDYGREEDDGVHIYPTFATVTYLSNLGGPTLVLDKVGTTESSIQFVGQVEKFTASKPLMGKHIAFNGALLHAAPSDLTEEDEEDDEGDDGDDDESSSDNSEVDPDAVNRVTFLVNIWINHIPKQCKKFPPKEISKMQTMNKSLALCFTNPPPADSRTTVTLNSDNCMRAKIWKFNNADVNYEVLVPLPEVEATKATIAAHDMIEYVYENPEDSKDPHSIQIMYAEDQMSGSEEEEGEGSGEEESTSGNDEASADDNDDAEEEEDEEEVKKVVKKRRL